MAKKTKLKIWIDGIWEDLFPETRSDLVLTPSGDSIDYFLETAVSDITRRLDTFDTAITETIDSFSREVALASELAKGAQQAVSYMDYAEMVESLQLLPEGYFKKGQNIFIATLNVPDLWVYGPLSKFTPFAYQTDSALVADLLNQGYIDIGFYRLSPLETGKVNLAEYVKFTDIEPLNAAIANHASSIAALQNGKQDKLTEADKNALIQDVISALPIYDGSVTDV